jgi:hypothetical protein
MNTRFLKRPVILIDGFIFIGSAKKNIETLLEKVKGIRLNIRN